MQFASRFLTARHHAALLLLSAGFAALLWLVVPSGPLRVPDYAAWHLLLELVAIAVSVAIFAIGWTTTGVRHARHLEWLACGFLGVALLDVSHVLSFEGMPMYFTANSIEKSIGFWLAARYLAALTLLAAIWSNLHARDDDKPPATRRHIALAIVLGMVALIYIWLLAMPQLAPTTFVHGEGLTSFKVLAEWGIIVLNLLALWFVWRRAETISTYKPVLLAAALLAMACSEVFFTLYRSPDDLLNLVGHLLKAVAYVMLYRAVFVGAVTAPYRSLSESSAHLSAVLEAIPDLLCEIDADGRILQLRASRAELMLLPPEAVAGSMISDVLPRESAAAVMMSLREAEANGYSQGQRLTVPMADDERYLELSVARKRDGRHAVPRYIALLRDVTESVREQAMLRKLRLAVEQSPSTIMITGLDSRMEYANRAFTESTGYSLEEALGRTPGMLHSGKTSKQSYESLWKALSEGEAWRGEFVNRRKDGSEYLESVLISPVTDADGKITSYLAIKDDITQRRRDQERIDQLSHFDALTGLPNRTLFDRRLSPRLQTAHDARRQLALLYFNVDNFKSINESLGRAVGDMLLATLGRRLQISLREDALTSHFGSDEFVVALPFGLVKTVAKAAERLQQEISRPCMVRGHEVVVTTCVGIAIFPDDGEDLETLLRAATAAQHQAKDEGRNIYRFFSADMQVRSARLRQLEGALRTAVAQNQLSVVYQPQIEIASGRVIGLEALVRWRHPELGQVSPAEFIPVAEASGQIIAIGEWVLRTAVGQARRWLTGEHADLILSVNLSLAQFKDANLLTTLDDVLATEGFPAGNLELELTESIAMDDPQGAILIVQSLHWRGILLSLDDFSTGYSSFSYLKRLQLHKLKIDKSFIDHIAHSETDVSIARAVIQMAHSLGMTTIAEGVETLAQRDVLRELGCEQGQGYLFSKPLPADELEIYLRSFASRPAPVDG